MLPLAFIMLWSLFPVNYKGASVRRSTAHPQNLTFCINGPTCPIHKCWSFNVSKSGNHLRGTMCLLSSGDSTKLIPNSFLEKYLHFYDNGQFKICWCGTINQKVHEPVLLWLTRLLCAKQSSWPHLCFAPNASYGSWIPFKALVFAFGTVDRRLVKLCCAEGDHNKIILLADVLLASFDLAKVSSVLQWHRFCISTPYGGGTGLCWTREPNRTLMGHIWCAGKCTKMMVCIIKFESHGTI